ncbi:hypothetical protein F5Y11DRAFT_347670 [Daldinia sp. FL1419]|nr:hypothetical protein F5Y11DRAFT_347670 [Daldinia sp. FL1419]
MGRRSFRMASSSQDRTRPSGQASEHSASPMDPESESRRLEVELQKFIRYLWFRFDTFIPLSCLRQTIGNKSALVDRNAQLREKLHEEFPQYWPLIKKSLPPSAKKLASIGDLKKLIEASIQAMFGFHQTLYFAVDPNNYYSRIDNTLHRYPRNPIATSKPNNFPQFSSLPPELRAMIWEFAVPAQDRFVDTYRLRKVKSAPCPVLFLVCKESKSWTSKFYKRVRNGNFLRGKILPIEQEAAGPVISFEHDIVMIGDWKIWNPRERMGFVSDIIKRRQDGVALRPIHLQIEKFSKVGLRRVAVNRPHTVHPEFIYYKNARNRVVNFSNLGVKLEDWSWRWTDKVEEVWNVDHIHNQVDGNVKEQVTRIFPPLPGEPCACTLCERADFSTTNPPPYKKPGPFDFEEHERLFDIVDHSKYWDIQTVVPPGILCDPR